METTILNHQISRHEKLIEFVKAKHKGQTRKYTGEPYFNHLWNVASEAQKTGIKFGFEIGLCHDLIEDTGTFLQELGVYLLSIGYTFDDANFITCHVEDLTDVFTTNFIYLNRKIRKECEALRLHTVDRVSQTIKCIDLIDNASTIVKHDERFAKLYIPEMRAILIGFKQVLPVVINKAWDVLLDAESELEPLHN